MARQAFPALAADLDGIPDLGFFNTVNPTTTTQTQWNGRLDADVTAKDHVSFAIYWVPVTNTDYNGPVRAANFWHHSQINEAISGDLEPYLLAHIVEPGTCECSRLAME